MTTILKWIGAVVFTLLAWLVGVYADEYFRPYKKIRTTPRNK